MASISGYYQIPEDQQPAGFTLVDGELIDFQSGTSLIDPADGLPLVGDTQETVIQSANAFSIALSNSAAIPARIVNAGASEVEYTLLGIQRSETALGLLGVVNTYGFNGSLWATKPGGLGLYKYFRDPADWTFQVGPSGLEYGWFNRHLASESALQVYALPPSKSFSYTEDDGTGRYPGGYTDGIINNYIESKRTFRYQPGRITGVTMGVRMSTGSNFNGEIVSWGCRNSYGDGYYFRLEKGTDLFIVRESPGLPTLKIARADWNGDPITTETGNTGWNLDLSKVTMFKIEFGWYGAIGATFLAYVPIGHDNARWVKLHSIRAEASNIVPSLVSPYLRIFVEAEQKAGATSPAFINLYGTSVYIDGGDEGTITTGNAATEASIINRARTILGIEPATDINNVINQKTIFPTSLSLSSDVTAKVDLLLRNPGIGNSEHYFFGYGTTISRTIAPTFAVTKSGNVLNAASGSIPSGLPFTPALSHGYLYSGYPVKVVASGLNNVFATSLTDTTIGLNRGVSTVTSVSLAAFDGYAIASGVTIVSGDGTNYGGQRQYTGKLYFTRPGFNTGGSYWRLGLWFNASGSYTHNSSSVYWLTTTFPGINYTLSGVETGEVALPPETNRQVGFYIVESGGFATVQAKSFRPLAPNPGPITITGSPFPIGIVAELYPGASLTDVVLSMATMPSGYLDLSGENFASAYDRFAIQASGRTLAVSGWIVSSGITQSTVDGADYVANKFEPALSSPLPGALVDKQGRRSLYSSYSSIATFFIASGESKSFSLAPYFGPDKTFLAGGLDTSYSTGALFVSAATRASGAVGSMFASLNWSEQ